MTLSLARFLDMIPKTQGTQATIDKLDLIKLKAFFASKGTIKKVKRQHKKIEENIYTS